MQLPQCAALRAVKDYAGEESSGISQHIIQMPLDVQEPPLVHVFTALQLLSYCESRLAR